MSTQSEFQVRGGQQQQGHDASAFEQDQPFASASESQSGELNAALNESPAQAAARRDIARAAAALREAANNPKLRTHRVPLLAAAARVESRGRSATGDPEALKATAEWILRITPEALERVAECEALNQRFAKGRAPQMSVAERIEAGAVERRIGEGSPYANLGGMYARALAASDEQQPSLELYLQAEQQRAQYESVVQAAKPGGFEDDVARFEGMAAQQRLSAVQSGVLNEETFQKWSELYQNLIVLRLQVQNNEVDPQIAAETTRTAAGFYRRFSAEVAGLKRKVGRAGTENRYSKTRTFRGKVTGAGPEMIGHFKAGRHAEGIACYEEVMRGLDDYVLMKIEREQGEDSDAYKGAQYIQGMNRELDAISEHKPKRVWATFMPDDKYGEDTYGTPLQLYYYREDGEWILKDLTNPERTFEDNVDAKSWERHPPHELFQELDYKSHFPKGLIRYQIPNGPSNTVETTESMSWVDWLTWAGVGVAAVGVGLVTFGTGTVAVVGTYALAASAVVGAAAAAGDMYEHADHGALTGGVVTLNLLQIVGGIAGAGALASGRIVVQAASTASKVGGATRLATLAGRAYVPLTATTVAADVATVVTMSVQAAEQLDAIEKGSGSEEEKTRAKLLLLGQLALTGGLVALSVKGDLPTLRGGGKGDIVLDMVDGMPVARGAGDNLPNTGAVTDGVTAKVNPDAPKVDATPSGGKAADVASTIPGEMAQTVHKRLYSQLGLEEGDIAKMVETQGVRATFDHIGDLIYSHRGLKLDECLDAMKKNPELFYSENGALVARAVLKREAARRGFDLDAAMAQRTPDPKLMEMANEYGFSFLTHFTTKGSGMGMLSTGSMVPGKSSGGYSWFNETTQGVSPTRAQSHAMADTKGAAQEVMPLALPESMLVNAKHAIEESWARRPGLDKLYVIKGGFQNLVGEAVGLPPKATSGNIMLVPKAAGLNEFELQELAGTIGGTMNTEAIRTQRLILLGVLTVGGAAYVAYEYGD